jgi:hypothetical protein
MTPCGIELATFRFVAQYVNDCATAVPSLGSIEDNLKLMKQQRGRNVNEIEKEEITDEETLDK